MPKMLKLPKNLQNTLFTTQIALKNGLNKKNLIALLQHDIIIRVTRGAYCPVEHDLSEEDQAVLATMIVGKPSALCLFSALSYHHVTDIIPKKIWVMVPAEKRTQHSQLRLYRTAHPRWHIGIQKENGYWITTIERTLVDSLMQKRLLGPQTAVEALRQAVKEKKTTLDKVFRMAVQLGGTHRIITYIEAMA